MAKRIIKKIGGDRVGSGNKMNVGLHGYGLSTHDVSKVRRTSMSFGTIVPMGQWLMTSKSRLRLKLDALITSNALKYQLYGSAKFQLDVFSARMALYNPKMLLNLNDQGYEIKDIAFPQMELTTRAITDVNKVTGWQVNPSSLLRMLGIAGNGVNGYNVENAVTRNHMAMWLLMYYQIGKEYYANKQEKIGYMIHNNGLVENVTGISAMNTINDEPVITELQKGESTPFPNPTPLSDSHDTSLAIMYTGNAPKPSNVMVYITDTQDATLKYISVEELFVNITIPVEGSMLCTGVNPNYQGAMWWWEYIAQEQADPELQSYDLKAIDRMSMRIMAGVEEIGALLITSATELPYGASFQSSGDEENKKYSINYTQEGLIVGTYQSDVFNNWLDNATINSLSGKSKVKVNEDGEFSIDTLNITQKMYNIDMRIGITDGTLDEWREVTYGQASKSKTLKPVYEGGLSKEIIFDMIVSTAGTENEALGSIASRGTFGSKHKGGYVQIEADEEKLVMVLAKITPRIVYNQGNDWTTNLKTLNDLHKPELDKIGYQNLLTDQMAYWETKVFASTTIESRSAGKQPAWQWYRTNYDDALGNMAETENYKVFGREYDAISIEDGYAIKDLTTYIEPMKFNDVFADKSIGAMNFDVQVGMDATMTLVMSEEVIPGL